MPCDIGYRSVADAAVVVAPPAIDKDLLDRLGVDDPVFLDWVKTLDTTPLLEAALGRMGVDEYRIENQALVGPPSQQVAERWQLEVLRVVLELLGYETELSGNTLVAEKHGASGVHEYVEIAVNGVIRFEHFASNEALRAEQDRFLAVAQKLGLRVRLRGERRAGQPIPKGTVHPHKTKGKA